MRLFLALLVLLPLGALRAADGDATAADRDFTALLELWQTPAPAGTTQQDRAFWEQRDRTMQAYVRLARELATKYPADPRRWHGLIQSSYTRPYFITGFKPEFDGAPGERNLLVDTAALLRFYGEQRALLTAAILAPDGDDRQRGGAFYALIADARGESRLRAQTFSPAVLRPVADQVIAQLGDVRALPVLEQFLPLLRQHAPVEAETLEASLRSNPKLAAALIAAAARRAAEAAQEAEAAKVRAADIGSVKFTAADGREVEIAKLKGKVVLVDFWATWCGPCVAELPNVKKVYAAYHDKGFEVVGITLENPNARPTDTPAQTATQLEAAKKKMLDFTAKNAMPWPQYFDGKWWKNDYAVKFGIKAIPAMFLLDKDGKIAATEARGEKLEAEVKRLLGL